MPNTQVKGFDVFIDFQGKYSFLVFVYFKADGTLERFVNMRIDC